MTHYDERVRRGIAALEDYQEGCTDRINLATLNLYSLNRCALAQAIGQASYSRGRELLGIPAHDNETGRYGFSLTESEHSSDMDSNYAELREAWVRLLTEHRKAQAPA